MNKSDLIEHVATKTGLTKAAATRAVNAMVDGLTTSIKQNKPISIAGLRSLALAKQAGSVSTNPTDGATPKRAPTASAKRAKVVKVPKFRPGKGLRDALG